MRSSRAGWLTGLSWRYWNCVNNSSAMILGGFPNQYLSRLCSPEFFSALLKLETSRQLMWLKIENTLESQIFPHFLRWSESKFRAAFGRLPWAPCSLPCPFKNGSAVVIRERRAAQSAAWMVRREIRSTWGCPARRGLLRPSRGNWKCSVRTESTMGVFLEQTPCDVSQTTRLDAGIIDLGLLLFIYLFVCWKSCPISTHKASAPATP